MSLSQPTIDLSLFARFAETKKRLRKMQLTDCLPQQQSPLFSVLPEGVRHTIFSMCLEEQDGETVIEIQEYFYRPDYTHCQLIETTLLTVCRQIYLETKILLRQNLIHREWLDNSRPQPQGVTVQLLWL
jgi:hypothetical protein